MRTMLLAVLMWLSTAPLHARPELGVALKGGPNAATQDEDSRANRYALSGGLAAYLRRPLAGRFSIAAQMELLYTPRGAKVVYDDQLQATFREHYFDVTLAARPEVRLGQASLYLLLGGGLNILLSASKENVTGSNQDLTHDLHRVDVSLLAGIGGAVHLPRRGVGPLHLGTVFLEARHDRGLIDSLATGGLKNRTSSLMLGLSFVLGSGTASSRLASAPVAASGLAE